MDVNAIVVKNLCLSFDGIKVLDGVDFTLRQGEMHALAGANGAGKSSLMKVLNGVYQKDSGEINIFGSTDPYMTPKEARSRGIAMVYQDLSLVSTLTVTENIFLSHSSFSNRLFHDSTSARKEAIRLLSLLGVDGSIDPDERVENISIGQQQLVEIAKALSGNPRILILDEPTASLSNSEIDILFKVILRLNDQGLSIIYITHYLNDIFKICDRITVLRDGSVVLDTQISETTIPEVVNSMVGTKTESTVVWNRIPLDPSLEPFFEVENLTTHSISNVSVKVYPGQVVGIAGLLGSGRTEFLRALYGLDRILSGRILIDGHEQSIRNTSDALQAGMAMVPEDRRKQGLLLDFSIELNIVLPILNKISVNKILNQNKSDKLVDHYIKYLKVKAQNRKQHVRYLSGGNQQKIVVAKCLASDARLLLLDDPTFGIDLHSKLEIMHIMREFTEAGKSIIFISSEFKELANFCDVIYIFHKGTLTSQTTERVTEDQLMQMVQ